MSVSLNREEGPEGSIDFSIPIATTQFFVTFWDRAIADLGLRLIQENASFGREKLPDVLDELARLKEWAVLHLTGNDLDYMKGRIEDLEAGIPGAFDREDTILSIY